jgi:hypothetical protein
MKTIVIILTSLFLIGLYHTLSAQGYPTTHVAPSWSTDELITDRPDQTESSATVPRKSLQIETGVVFENYSNGSSSIKNWGLGTTLFRYGLLENLELRLGTSYQVSTLKNDFASADSVQQGMGPVSAGMKVYITQEKGFWPEVAILADLTINQLAALDFRPTYNYSTLKIAASHTLNNRFGLGYNLGYAYNGTNPKGYFIYSIALGMSISERLGAYLESYGNFDPGAIPRHRFDGGFTYLISQNMQIDIAGGFGPKDTATMIYGSVGFSWRIPE